MNKTPAVKSKNLITACLLQSLSIKHCKLKAMYKLQIQQLYVQSTKFVMVNIVNMATFRTTQSLYHTLQIKKLPTYWKPKRDKNMKQDVIDWVEDKT